MVTKEYIKGWVFELPDGWVKAFGDDLVNDLYGVAVRAENAHTDYEFHISQIKEKFGQLRVYYASIPEPFYDEIERVIDRYTDLSEKTCVVCGKEGCMTFNGWYEPLCEEHRGNKECIKCQWI